MKWKFWEKEIPKVEPKPEPICEPRASFLLATNINPIGLVSIERVQAMNGNYFTEIRVRSNDDPTKTGSWKHYVSYEQHEAGIRKIQDDPCIKCIVV